MSTIISELVSEGASKKIKIIFKRNDGLLTQNYKGKYQIIFKGHKHGLLTHKSRPLQSGKLHVVVKKYFDYQP